MSIGDATAEMIPSHVTLVPPAEISAEDFSEIEGHLDRVAGGVKPFPIHLRGTGTFRPTSAVVFVALAEGIASCERLAGVVRSGPLDVEVRFPYHPHVTIAQDLEPDVLDRAFKELAGFECRFIVEGFHLYVHDDIDGWRPTREFALRAPVTT